MTTEGGEGQKRFARDERVRGLVGEEECERLCGCMGVCAGRGKLEFVVESIKALHKAGIDIVWYAHFFLLGFGLMFVYLAVQC